MYSRKLPTKYSGFTAIKEDGTVKTSWRKSNRLEVDEEEATKKVPAKKDVTLKKDL